MNFSFTEEQRLLRESVDKFVAAEYPFETRRALAASENGFSREHWRKFAELGWLGLGIPEEAGGVGGGPVETAIVMTGLGAGLAVEPYLATVVLGGYLLGQGAVGQQDRLARLAAGELQLAFGFAEPESRYELGNIAVRAERDGAGYRLTGTKSVVFNAPAADLIAVSARTAGDVRDREGITVFLLDASTPGLVVRGYRTVDGSRAGEVDLDGVPAGSEDVIGAPEQGIAVVEGAVDAGIVAVCAEAAGIMAFMHRSTVEYLKHREQFGTALATFQVLQHRLVDMYMACELSHSMACMAAVRLAEQTPAEADGGVGGSAGDPTAERRRAVAAAKVQIGRAGRFVGENAIQLHGGMGMTDEMPVSHYFKRLTLIDSQFGDADHHLRQLAGTGA